MDGLNLIGLVLTGAGSLLLIVYAWKWAHLDRLGFANVWPFGILSNIDVLDHYLMYRNLGLYLFVPGLFLVVLAALVTGKWLDLRGIIAGISLITVAYVTPLIILSHVRARNITFPDDLREQYRRCRTGLVLIWVFGLILFWVLSRTFVGH